jgi:hypothetical protein
MTRSLGVVSGAVVVLARGTGVKRDVVSSQSAEAENCYGPFADAQFRDPEPAFGWAGSDRLIWERRTRSCR